MDNLELLKRRARLSNNDRQHLRMVEGKQKSFHRALLYSYQTAWIKKDGAEDYVRALINPDKVKFDYDEKILSVDFQHGFEPGDSFEWKNTGTHWLVLRQELSELAYFRSNIRRCQQLEVTDPETGEKDTIWMAIRGPVETKINSIQKAGIVADVPNLSLVFYIKYTERNVKLFDRYSRFAFAGKYWQVQAPDIISTPGIIEVTAMEDFECHHNELIVEKVDPNKEPEKYEAFIEGETFVKPLETTVFTINGTAEGDWGLELPNSSKDIEDMLEWSLEDDKLQVTWIGMISGSYIVSYGDLSRTIIVESLF